MGGSTRKSSNQGSITNPWQPTIGQFGNVLAQLNQFTDSPGLTPTETGALGNLRANAAAGNPYAPAIGTLASDLLAGGGSPVLDATARGDYLDPNTNPYLGQLLGTIGDDVRDRVNSMFAGAGRNLSGMNLQTLARGISQGTAPVLAGMYGQERQNQLNAIQTALANRQAGIGTSTQALQAQDAPWERLLQLEQQQRGIPLQNIANYENLLLPLGQLGGTQDEWGLQTQKQPLGQQVAGGILGALGPLAKILAPLAPMLPLLFSDARAKDAIGQVGELYDKTPVYSFRYKGDSTPRIGLMAQDVEKTTPEAVYEIGGLKAVDYDLATRRSALMGILGGIGGTP